METNFLHFLQVFRKEPHGRPADVWNMAVFLLQLLFFWDFLKLQSEIKQSSEYFTLIKTFLAVSQYFFS